MRLGLIGAIALAAVTATLALYFTIDVGDKHATTPGDPSKKVGLPIFLDQKNITTSKDAQTSAQVQVSIEQVLANPSHWIGLAQSGQAKAAIAVFNASLDCDPLLKGISDKTADTRVRPECEQVPKSAGWGRLRWLDLAAERGDPEAGRLYALNASVLGRLEHEIKAQPPYEKDYVYEKASRYLQAAALTGDVRALTLAYQANRFGYFGGVDQVKALTYLEALAMLSPDAASVVARELASEKQRLPLGAQVQITENAQRIAVQSRR